MCQICYDQKYVFTTSNGTSILQSGERATLVSMPCKECNDAEYQEWLKDPDAFWERKYEEDEPRREFSRRVIAGEEPTKEMWTEAYGDNYKDEESRRIILKNLKSFRKETA